VRLGLVLALGGGIPLASIMECSDYRGVKGTLRDSASDFFERRRMLTPCGHTLSPLRVLALRPLTPWLLWQIGW